MGDIGGSIVWTALFVCFTALVIAPVWMRHLARMAALKIVGEAIARGQPLDTVTAEHLSAGAKSTLPRWFTFACLFCGAPALTMGVGVGIALTFFPEALGLDEATRTSMIVPALYAGSAGVGLTAIGLVCLRLFLLDREQ